MASPQLKGRDITAVTVNVAAMMGYLHERIPRSRAKHGAQRVIRHVSNGLQQ